MSRGRVPGLALAIVLPAALLAGGWLWASGRGLERREAGLRQQLLRATDAVRAAAVASLAELREREDERPFYLYNRYYSPPEVLAVSDPVALSPLARGPGDARGVAHFQLDPDGRVRTPYVREAGETIADPALAARAARVAALVERPGFAALRERVRPAAGPSLLSALPAASAASSEERATASRARNARAVRDAREVAPDAPGVEAREAGSSRALGERVAGDGSAAEEGAAENAAPEGRAAADGAAADTHRGAPGPAATEAGAAETDGAETDAEEAPAGPLALGLNQWSNAVYDELLAAQQGSPRDNRRLQQRGRQMPLTQRAPARYEGRRLVPQRPPAGSERDEDARAERHVDGAPAPTALATQRAAEVAYTPMEWTRVGDDLVLHRVVSHEGARVVQGLLLDGARLRERWLPALAARHGVAVLEGREVQVEVRAPGAQAAGDEAACVVREPAGALLAADLCVPAEAAAAAFAEARRDRRTQLAVLLVLLLLATGAVVAIARAARRAQELSRQKSAFVSAVSHELRTPLTTLRMHAEMLAEGMVGEERRPRVHDELVSETHRLGRLVENVLEITRLEEGRRSLRRERLDLRARVRELLAAHAERVARAGFTLVSPEAGRTLPASVEPQALEQILVNLIDNALKYGGGAENEVAVRVGLREGEVFVEVSDRGPGVPEAEREKVLERFHRVEREETAHMPGTGIGLALVWELAWAHGGDVEVGEAPGGGCRVVVTLGPRA